MFVVDTFMFYNEFKVLELRLEMLDPWVDRFVLVEAEVNHIGGPKELFFERNKERYAKWLDKIVHIVVSADEVPKDKNPWSREKFQRECVLRGLDGVPDDAMVMISDVDEIPAQIKFPLPNVVCSVHMWMFEYSFRHLFVDEPWFGTVVTNCELFKRVGPNYLRDNRWKFPYFKTAGWHLSSFGTPELIRNKMSTYAHALDDTHVIKDIETYRKWIENGTHINGTSALVCRPSSVPLPASDEILLKIGLL